ncbi:MAG: DUF389 domain-containing protein [Yonghaparkia sp.]|nr:DUF389 domain-containing protein [Microcella sp.]
MESRFSTPQQMRESVFIDGPEARGRLSRFWLLLVLSAIIAAAGVVADSTAAVIGAMIVAPLLGPIQGTMLATVLGDRANLVRSLLLVVAGALVAIAIGFAVGMLVTGDVVAATNSQVAGRVSPRLIDLLAALGTGVVGSVALVRRDISDTLPGVAIAISLVPPLTVVGLTLESGAVGEALGALLLFVTNVVAIIATGIAVMTVYGVTKLAAAAQVDGSRRASLRKPVVLLLSMLIIIGVPLSLTSLEIGAKSIIESAVVGVVEEWGADAGWRIQSIDYSSRELTIHLEGPLPQPDTDALEALLVDRGVDPAAVTIVLVPVYEVELGG